jgi:nucleoid-associated protein YgaU
MNQGIALSTGGSPAPASGSAANGGGQGQQIAKAQLFLYQAKPNSGGATTGEQRGVITFQFNPKEVTIAKSAKWGRESKRDAKKAGAVEFNGSDPCKLTMEMFVDATAKHDSSVVSTVETLFSCLVPTEVSLGKKKAMPPLVVLQWGQVRSFTGFITQVSAKYTLFASDGTPIRAACSVTIEEMPSSSDGSPPGQNPTSGSLAVRESKCVVEGDTLASIAYREYDDAAMWRLLADYNGVDDPMRMRAGTILMLPTPEELQQLVARDAG